MGNARNPKLYPCACGNNCWHVENENYHRKNSYNLIYYASTGDGENCVHFHKDTIART